MEVGGMEEIRIGMIYPDIPWITMTQDTGTANIMGVPII